MIPSQYIAKHSGIGEYSSSSSSSSSSSQSVGSENKTKIEKNIHKVSCFDQCRNNQNSRDNNNSEKEKEDENDINTCECIKSHRPCFNECSHICQTNNPLNLFQLPPKPNKSTRKSVQLSVCALDHLDIVKSLTTEDLEQKYDLACLERWGPEEHGKKRM